MVTAPFEFRPRWMLRREIRRLREELRIREESQIPVIPVAARGRLVRYETALARILHFPFDVNETTAHDLIAVKRMAERALYPNQHKEA